jgi:hypothetical protein
VRAPGADVSETVSHVTSRRAAFDLIPESVEGRVIRAEVAEVVDRDGPVGCHGRIEIRILLTVLNSRNFEGPRPNAGFTSIAALPHQSP